MVGDGGRGKTGTKAGGLGGGGGKGGEVLRVQCWTCCGRLCVALCDGVSCRHPLNVDYVDLVSRRVLSLCPGKPFTCMREG